MPLLAYSHSPSMQTTCSRICWARVWSCTCSIKSYIAYIDGWTLSNLCISCLMAWELETNGIWGLVDILYRLDPRTLKPSLSIRSSSLLSVGRLIRQKCPHTFLACQLTWTASTSIVTTSHWIYHKAAAEPPSFELSANFGILFKIQLELLSGLQLSYTLESMSHHKNKNRHGNS